jgi:hypothetical protein
MATLIERFPDCYGGIIVEDGERVPSIDMECVWRHLERDGLVIDEKLDLVDVKVTRYMEFDSKHALVKIKGKGWFAIVDGKPALRTLARSLV